MSKQAIAPKVGDSVWVFDINHREYPKDANGRFFGSPIWRKHWVEAKIKAETSRSYDLGFYGKCPKKRSFWDTHKFAFSLAEIDALEWEQSHSREIARLIRNGNLTSNQWEQIAVIIGYKPEESA